MLRSIWLPTSAASVGRSPAIEKVALAALRADMMQLMSIDASDTDSTVLTLKKIGEIIGQIAGMGKFTSDRQTALTTPGKGRSVPAS